MKQQLESSADDTAKANAAIAAANGLVKANEGVDLTGTKIADGSKAPTYTVTIVAKSGSATATKNVTVKVNTKNA